MSRLALRARTFFALSSLVSGLLVASTAGATGSYELFEGGQSRPLALSPSGKLLFAVNTPDARLEVFRVSDHGAVTHQSSIPVGLEPIAVAARSENEVWVVNQLSDSVSIVDVRDDHARVTRTLLVGDEPRDIVFAGPHGNRAFVTAAHRGQNVPFDPQLTAPGVGRADVWVFDADHLGSDLNGGPINIITLFMDSPRGLAVTPDGSKVYAAGFNSGNRTATVTEFLGLPLPPPTTNFEGLAQPQVGMIVKFDGSHWVDELGRPWDQFIQFSLPDRDVFTIDATLDPPAEVPGGSFASVGTVLYNMAVNPVNGHVYVSNTEARNEERFEGPGDFAGHSVQGHHNLNRISVLGAGGSVTPRHLNKQIDFNDCCASIPNSEASKSLALPTQMAVSKDGAQLFVAAMGSSKIGVYSTTALENDTFVPNANDQIQVSGGGPTGVLVDKHDSNRLYVMTRFDNSISVVDVHARTEVAHVPMFDPEPPSVKSGRRFLYDATLSSHGDSACASCHVFGDKDDLAWDLGNPDTTFETNNNPIRISLKPDPIDPSFPPMKGPLTTQSLRGMANHGPMHWRGDRTGSLTEPNVQPDSGAYDEHEGFLQFQKGFTGLLGRPTDLAPEDMEAFTDFILQLRYPPNPIRALDDSLTPDQQAGSDFFFNRTSDSGVISCEGCHRTDRQGNAQFGVDAPGFFGTEGESAREVFPQIFKIPHLRNVYTKVGMFGMFPLMPLIEEAPGSMGFQGDQIRGFGVSRAGDIDTIFRFVHATNFSTHFVFGPNPDGFPSGTPEGEHQRRQVEQFILAFDSNMKPIVGQQITLTKTSGSSVSQRVDLLLDRADAGDCDVVVKGRLHGDSRGWLYLDDGSFQSDRSCEAPISEAGLRASVHGSDDTLTFTCAPPGTGYRMAIDRDDDGVFDGDDHHDDDDDDHHGHDHGHH